MYIDFRLSFVNFSQLKIEIPYRKGFWLGDTSHATAGFPFFRAGESGLPKEGATKERA